MIADFLTVKHEYAYLIDLALGDWAQRFLVRDLNALMDALAARTEPLPVAQLSATAVLGLPTSKTPRWRPLRAPIA